MRFSTLDIEFADVILPSICSISIIDWDDSGITNQYSTYINPDCEIDEYFKDRHKITLEQTKTSPLIGEAWIDIFNHLENRIIFSHYANRNIRALKSLADINYLNMPPLIYCCSASISRKLWPYFKNDTLPEITERLGISTTHFNSLEDAKSVGYIVKKAMNDMEIDSLPELFDKIGFTGGIVKEGERYIYRAIKKESGYLARVKDVNNIYGIDWIKANYYQEDKDIIKNSLFFLERRT